MGLSAFGELSAQQQTWSYNYNEFGEVTSEDGPRQDVQDVTTHVYDNQGNRVSTTNALGQTTIFNSYDGAGRLLSVTDPNGVTTDFTYHVRGWLTGSRIKHPSGDSAQDAVTTYSYDAIGQMTGMTLPNGASLSYEYDAARRLTAVSNPLGERIEYTLDAAGNRTQEIIKDSAGTLRYSVSRAYDELSRVMDMLGNNSQHKHRDYDANDNRVASTDGRQHQTQYVYDALDRVSKVIDPTLGETHYTYNYRDQITSVTDPEGLVTAYTYDAFGNLTTISSPDTGTATYTYDAAGNRTSATDSRGVVTEYTYDALNRLTQVVYPGSPGENITYTYDDTTNGNLGVGRLTGISDASGETSYRYNYLGLVTEKRASIGGVTAVVNYEYDSAGQLTQLTYPSGRIVTYERDSQGRIAGVATQSGSQATSVLLDDIQYLPFGPATYYTYGNGLSHNLAYDLDYRLTRINVEGIDPILERTYSYDPVNNITGIANGLNSQKSQFFDYDALDRLIQAEGFYGLINYTYDGVGNRLSRTLDDGSITQETYRYASDSHRLLGVDQTTDGAPGQNRGFTYDAAGNPITRTGEAGEEQVFTYNAANRMAEVTVDQSAAASYTYNALGQRVKKALANGPAELMLYDEQGQLLAVTDGAGNTLREYIYFNNQQIAFIDYGINASGQLYYIHNDHLGTPQVATDPNQQVVWMADYQPFGKLLPNSQNSTELFSRFPGQYEDAETGLYYNYFRDYDPSLGRYLQSDPIGLNGGINTYGYVHQNPLTYADPTGQAACGGVCVGAIVLALLTAKSCSDGVENVQDGMESFASSQDAKQDAINCALDPFCDSRTGEALAAQTRSQALSGVQSAASATWTLGTTIPGTTATGSIPTNAQEFLIGGALQSGAKACLESCSR